MPPEKRTKVMCHVTGQLIDFETEIDPPYELIRQYEEIVKKQKDKKDKKGNPKVWHPPQGALPPPLGQPL